MTLEKQAQKKSVVNILNRNLNPMEIARRTFSPRYNEVYNKIKEVDTNMREIALSSDPGIRDSLHEARMAYKNREYPKVVFYAWKLLESVDGIFDGIDELEQIKDMVMREFHEDSSKLTDEEIAQMNKALGKPATKLPKASKLKYLLYTVAAPDIELLKTADSAQWLKENIPTFHQMEGALLDRIFRNKLGKQREAAKRALNIAEKVYSSIKEVFRLLDEARTDFSSYISIAKRFQNKFDQQKQELSTLYQTYFADIVPSNHTEQTPPVAPVVTQPPTVPQPLEVPQANISTPGEPVSSSELIETSEPIQAPVFPQEQEQVPEQAESEYEESGPPTLPSIQINKPAAMVVYLWKKAEAEAKKGNKGISAALLAKASEICDDNNDSNHAKLLIQAAEKVLKG